nr:hypothetical protein Itr_chr10CG18180 [Ipomoea trifida]
MVGASNFHLLGVGAEKSSDRIERGAKTRTGSVEQGNESKGRIKLESSRLLVSHRRIRILLEASRFYPSRRRCSICWSSSHCRPTPEYSLAEESGVEERFDHLNDFAAYGVYFGELGAGFFEMLWGEYLVHCRLGYEHRQILHRRRDVQRHVVH